MKYTLYTPAADAVLIDTLPVAGHATDGLRLQIQVDDNSDALNVSELMLAGVANTE